MSDDKKRVSQFPGRRSELSKAVASVIATDQPTVGGSQGDFKRDPCGTCLSWRRDPRAGQHGIPLNAGQCFFGPPSVHPIMSDTGQMLASIIIRAPMTSDHEGCDQHDDGTDDDGTDGGGEPASALAQLG